MNSTYNAYEQQGKKKFRKGLFFSVSIVLLFTLGLGYIVFDLVVNPGVIDETENQAILGEFKSTIDKYKTVDAEKFTLEIPGDWVEVNRPELIENGSRYYPVRYQGVTGQDVGRRIDIYEAVIPDIAVERILSIADNYQSTFTVGSVSPNCSSFSEKIDDRRQPVPTTWEDRTFRCSLSTSRNSVAAVRTSIKEGVTLVGGESGSIKYLVVYTDHGSHVDNEIFVRILKSFKAK